MLQASTMPPAAGSVGSDAFASAVSQSATAAGGWEYGEYVDRLRRETEAEYRERVLGDGIDMGPHCLSVPARHAR